MKTPEPLTPEEIKKIAYKAGLLMIFQLEDIIEIAGYIQPAVNAKWVAMLSGQGTPYAYEYGNSMWHETNPRTNEHIRAHGKKLYTHPASEQQESALMDAARQALGWTLPDAVRKILEKGLWEQPTHQDDPCDEYETRLELIDQLQRQAQTIRTLRGVMAQSAADAKAANSKAPAQQCEFDYDCLYSAWHEVGADVAGCSWNDFVAKLQGKNGG